MATFAEVKKHAEGHVMTVVGKETPAGHFEATTKIFSNLVTYLLEGEKDSLEAVVKGSVIIVERDGKLSAIAYSKGALIGGHSLGEVPNFGYAFAQMVN